MFVRSQTASEQKHLLRGLNRGVNAGRRFAEP